MVITRASQARVRFPSLASLMQRRAYLMRLKKERIADYVELHRKENVWRSVVDCLVRSGTTRMIILLHGQDVILFEEAHDLPEAYQVHADQPTQRWEAMISGSGGGAPLRRDQVTWSFARSRSYSTSKTATCSTTDELGTTGRRTRA